MLQKYGVDRPGTGFHKKVKAYDLGGKIGIVDPLTKQMTKKDAKPFMVNTTVISLEQGRLVLPHSEDTSVLTTSIDDKDSDTGGGSGLVQQMRNFSIERVSDTGRVKYSAEDEHTLTAYMLAITGFMLEFSDIRRNNVGVDIKKLAVKNEDNEVEPEGNRKISEVARQIGLGENPSKDLVSKIKGGKRKTDSIKRGIAKNDPRVMRSYFVNKPSGRGLGVNGSRGL